MAFTWLIVLTTLIVVVIIIRPIEGQQELVPCLFFMGDSLSDNGNNNNLVTSAKANYSPYGIDFSNGPSGRFSNGRIGPDFVAELLGFKKSVPPFAVARGFQILKGVNYASASSGILDDTGINMGDRISLNMQLLNHGMTTSKIALLLENATLARKHLQKCLYFVNTGSNDYLLNYLQSRTTFYTPYQFATKLINHYFHHLKMLYNYGARKIVVYGLGFLGCTPGILSKSPLFNGTTCIYSNISKLVEPFNTKLKTLVDTFNSSPLTAQFIFINTTSISLLDTLALGIEVTTKPCCVVSEAAGGLCVPKRTPCSNRNRYTFWDNYHPSEVFTRATTARAFNAALPTDAYPFDIHRFAQQ